MGTDDGGREIDLQPGSGPRSENLLLYSRSSIGFPPRLPFSEARYISILETVEEGCDKMNR